MAFLDLFSKKPDLYARARPSYPDALFEFIAARSPSRERAWDCATGNGQAALGLARHFAAVEATDASAAQVEHAIANERITYSVGLAEGTHFAPASFDAVTAASALHWFDLDRFYPEVRRVLKPGGIFAAWGYTRHFVADDFDAQFKRTVLDAIRDHWPKESAKLHAGYRDVGFPFEPVEAPAFTIEMRWSLEELLAYAATWSATQAYVADHPGFLAHASESLSTAWGNDAQRVVRLPMHLRCGRRA
ncbi:MAG TPA: class I SAM-dependent methyltransferase [Usitatibacter sp.]|nr:class I SAM-dependent methyltransferase [Usitatibacter sp.]